MTTPLTAQRKHQNFRLDALGQTLVWCAHKGDMPLLLYIGETLPLDAELDTLVLATQLPLPHGALDVPERVTWLPEPGRGFTDMPGLLLRRGQQQIYTQFTLDAAQRLAEGWCFTLSDAAAALALTLNLSIDTDTGVCSAWCELHNHGREPLAVDRLMSLALPVPAHFSQRLSLGGRWAQEFALTRAPVGDASWHRASRLGRSSHHAYPGVLLMSEGAGSAQGEVLSLQLECSGNHEMTLQGCRLGGVQLQAGALLLPGEVTLAPGASQRSASVHLAWGGAGLRELSTRWHRFVRTRVLPRSLAAAPRLVQFNSWEATYFNHDAQRLRDLAAAAAAVGVERFVLDDGWFVGRRDDRAGLGDWSACPERYPQGLLPLAQHCQQLGMRFGLWVEPEGVNADSALYRAHPDWVLGDATRSAVQQPLGRHQFVLNFGLAAVRENLLAQLHALLQSAPIDFLKWDMNRDMTLANGPDGCAGVAAHLHGVHDVMQRLRQAHPALEIETCASGGGRADLGMLRHCERVWVSDNNDPLERQRIHAGFLTLLPAAVMGAHVGDARCHGTGAVTSIGLRTLTALFGHMGVEANLLDMPEVDREALRAAIAFYKSERDWMHAGDASTIDSPDPALVALLARSARGDRALLSVVALASTASAQLAPLRVHGLLRDARYEVRMHPLWTPNPRAGKTAAPLQSGETLCLTGQLLASAGIALPLLGPGGAVLYQLRRL